MASTTRRDAEGADGNVDGAGGRPEVVVRSKRRVFNDVFKVDEVVVSHRQTDGTMSADKRRLVFERGDSVAALIYNRDTNRVVLVREFKAGTLEKGRDRGFILEVMAGTRRENETPEQAVRREALEETGYELTDVEFVAQFFSSPGGTSERIFLYYAVVTDAQKKAPGGGVAADGEDIRIVELTPNQLAARLAQHEIEDPKLVIGAYHLQERLKIPANKPAPLRAGTIVYESTATPGLRIGIKTGDIRNVKGVDLWVNSENTDMMMDRVIGRSISATIRYLGAEKDKNNHIIQDTIADALRRGMKGRGYVRLGTVIGTEPGALEEWGAKRILHVATARSLPGQGISTDVETVAQATRSVLDDAEKRNRRILRMSKDTSLVMPLIGTGDGGLTRDQVAPALVDAIADFFVANPSTRLRDIFVLAYTGPDRAALEVAIEGRGDFRRI